MGPIVWQPPGGHAVVKAWVKGVPFEDAAREQVENLASLPFIYPHIAVMPDVHWGMGATVGSVIPTQGAIIPAAVGVDIGCGMLAVRLHETAGDLPESLSMLRSAIEAAVPHGRTNNGQPGDRGAWGTPPEWVQKVWSTELGTDYLRLKDRCPGVAHPGAMHQLGTLGTGNHFIEVCLDEEQRVWVVLHSGSRGAGNRIGSRFIELAKEDMRRHFINLPDANLAYLPEGSEHFQDYMDAVTWAQRYAEINREVMMDAVLDALERHLPPEREWRPLETAVSCHHNYVAREHHGGANVWVTRKGAVCARAGTMGIIPGSMGARSYIVRGKGNADSLNSCSHGAGRAMSRNEAKKRFSLEDHALATQGVECRKDAAVLDETPAAYKDIDLVMEAQRDLVEIVHTLKQVLCVKG